MRFGLIVDDVAYQAPNDFMCEVMPLLGISDPGDLSHQHLKMSNFSEYHPEPHAAVAPLVKRITEDESVRSNMDDDEARKWLDMLTEFWNWCHWRGYQSNRAYAIGRAAMLAANEAVGGR